MCCCLQDFEKLWRKHEKSTTQEKDVIIFDLKFPVSSAGTYVAQRHRSHLANPSKLTAQ
jgi:hypothetical protein